MRAREKRKLQEEKEERLLARWLLFGKGNGQMKNLTVRKEREFIWSVIHKAYDRYMSDLTMGTKTRLKPHRLVMTKYTPSRPPSFKKYRRIWYGCSKGQYRRWDVPRLMRMKWEALQNGRTDSPLPECGGRYMQELRRSLGERERGNLDIPLRDLQVHPSSVEGQHQGQEQLRERRKKTPASNRDAATVGA
jgi:hypothetical protein